MVRKLLAKRLKKDSIHYLPSSTEIDVNQFQPTAEISRVKEKTSNRRVKKQHSRESNRSEAI